MDTAICGGDFALGANGLPYRISGKEALLQRAYILLRIPKGSFCYQTDLGSEIALLEQDEEFSMRVKEAAQELSLIHIYLFWGGGRRRRDWFIRL